MQLNIDPVELAGQIMDYRPLAQHIQKVSQCTTFDAWKGALEKRACKHEPRSRANHPQGALRTALMRLPIYAPS